MFNNLRYVLVTGLLLLTVEQLKAQTGPCGPDTYPCCCDDCSCSYCGDIEACSGLELPPFSEDPGSWCAGSPEGPVCGGSGSACVNWWDNNTEGVVTDESVTTYGPGGCIPIDGGLGFLIAGGLGIGVIGIRRRKEELEVERD